MCILWKRLYSFYDMEDAKFLDSTKPRHMLYLHLAFVQFFYKELAAFARSWNTHGLRSEHHVDLKSLPLWMRSMATRQIVHPSDQFHSLQDAATAHNRPPEFYLSESDQRCFFSLPRANQRICVNVSTVMNINQSFTLYLSLL